MNLQSKAILGNQLAEACSTTFGKVVGADARLHAGPVSYTHLDVYKRQEVPVTDADLAPDVFGAGAAALLDRLVADGVLRRRPTGIYWAGDDSPAAGVSLRGIGRPVRVVERSTGRVVGLVLSLIHI